MTKPQAAMAALLTPTSALAWKTFVAEYVVLMTATKANRAFTDGYQVVIHPGKGYEVLWHGTSVDSHEMTADELYPWLFRYPLAYFAREADDLRGRLLTQ